ncbi:MAG TPA: PilZ domain-containing protein [Candidatus Baltobacteraceae bacterium]|nr:PilZ domain-containing protein [Candidatus Baltobacteraceae bacterium]
MTIEASRRRSMRVLLSVPIRVNGKTITNENFDEMTRTLVVNAHGALISLQAPVSPNQRITITNKATNHASECRVVHVGTQAAGKLQVGIEFVKPSASFWQIDFPPDDWVTPES